MSAGAPIVSTLLQWLSAAGGLTGIGAAFKVSADRRKSKIDATKVITDTALGMLTPLQAQASRLNHELTGSQVEASQLREQMAKVADELGAARAAAARMRQDVRTLLAFIATVVDGADIPELLENYDDNPPRRSRARKTVIRGGSDES